MPPRFVYWTILAGGLPTAFRATEREDLLPTFRRIKEKHPDAEIKWFARGTLWESKEAADRERDERRARAQERFGGAPKASSHKPSGVRDRESRPRDWRPGGEHRDPRQKFKDAKKARNQDRRQERFVRKQGTDGPRVEGPPAGRPRSERPRSEQPPAERPKTDRPRSDRPQFDRPRPRSPHAAANRSVKPPFDRPKGSEPDSGRPLPTRPLPTQPSRPSTRPGGWKNRPPRPESRARDRRFDDRAGKSGPDKDKRRK
jgi:ATP-dependent RNA helicase DeaD